MLDDEQEYEDALHRIEELMEIEMLSDEQGEELSRLVDAVIAYEEIHFPIPMPNSESAS